MLISLIILLLAIPLGFLVSWMARDELLAGRKWFKVIIIASIIAGIWFYLTGQTHITYTSVFILITTLVSLTKSYDKRWTKKRL